MGNQFVQQYFTVLHANPKHLHRFYSDGSTLTHADFTPAGGLQVRHASGQKVRAGQGARGREGGRKGGMEGLLPAASSLRAGCPLLAAVHGQLACACPHPAVWRADELPRVAAGAAAGAAADTPNCRCYCRC